MKKSHVHPTKRVLLIESAWEVCNQVGGIYTVIRSKIPTATHLFKGRYCLTGLFTEKSNAEFQRDKTLGRDIFSQACLILSEEKGWRIQTGRWLVTGEPRTVLFELESYNVSELWNSYEDSGIMLESISPLVRDALILGDMNRQFVEKVGELARLRDLLVLAHFHEWMSSAGLYRLGAPNVKTIFTTHATLLGRYLAMNDPNFYDNLETYNAPQEARHFNILNEVTIERFCAQKSDFFSTVSETTSRECKSLLGRTPDGIMPNGLNINRFLAMHESQNLHAQYKDSINKFVINHFFPYYSFDLDNTLYFFTSGRYEYRNKGFDLTLKALYLLNERLKRAKSPVTIVFFFITKAPYHSLNPEVLELNGLTQEIDKTSSSILKTAQKKFFHLITKERQTDPLPPIDHMIEDYDRLKLKRLIRSWRRKGLPKVVTHNLINDQDDPILEFLREYQFFNQKENPVKIVYLPDFITATNPLWGIDYREFVRGCHLGVFPSYYEPWGYTPLECIASGIPTITSDLAGFGEYSKGIVERVDGITTIPRYQKTEAYSLEVLTRSLWQASQLDRRERIAQRSLVETHANIFDWNFLYKNYLEAYVQLEESLTPP